MSEYAEQVQALLDQAQTVERGPLQVSMVEEAVRLADAHGDLDLGIRTRRQLMEAASFGGRPDLLLVTFSWCLGQYDRAPERVDEFELLWIYKWVVGNVTGFPEVSREEIDGLFADMRRRYQRAGSTLHAVYQKKRDVLLDMGDLAGAKRANRQMARVARDRFSDCAACVRDNELDFLTALGRDEDALAAVQPILKGHLRCAEVPCRTYAKILLPLLRLGRADEAMAYHRKGYRPIASSQAYPQRAAHHLTFLALTDNLSRALTLLQRHLPDALAAPDQEPRFEFFLACRLLLDRLAEQNKEALKLRLPPSFAVPGPKGRYPLAELTAWFAGQLDDLAGRFDARNGNDWHGRRVAGLAELKKLVTPCPFMRRRQSENEDVGT